MRKPRVRNPYTKYHVYSRGNRKEEIFLDQQDYWVFHQKLEEVHKKYDFQIEAYCLMSNHYHLLISVGDDDISKIFHNLNMRYSIYFNKKYSKWGKLFGSRFQSKNISTNDYYKVLLRYIHCNLLEAGQGIKTFNKLFCSYNVFLDKSPLFKHHFYKGAFELFNRKESEFIEFHADKECWEIDHTHQYSEEIYDYLSKSDQNIKPNLENIIMDLKSEFQIKLSELRKILKLNKPQIQFEYIHSGY